MLEGYGVNKVPEEQEDYNKSWDQLTSNGFYEQIIEFYKDKRQMRCYGKGGKCDSKSDNDD
jgi:hypothetical protein